MKLRNIVSRANIKRVDSENRFLSQTGFKFAYYFFSYEKAGGSSVAVMG